MNEMYPTPIPRPGVNTFPCGGCRAETPWHLLDGKPSARAMAWHGTLDAALAANSEIDRFLCEDCYGPGWAPSIECATKRRIYP